MEQLCRVDARQHTHAHGSVVAWEEAVLSNTVPSAAELCKPTIHVVLQRAKVDGRKRIRIDVISTTLFCSRHCAVLLDIFRFLVWHSH